MSKIHSVLRSTWEIHIDDDDESPLDVVNGYSRTVITKVCCALEKARMKYTVAWISNAGRYIPYQLVQGQFGKTLMEVKTAERVILV